MRDLTSDPSHFYIKGTVQTFLDAEIIHSASDIARRWYQPKHHDAGALIQRDQPWEHITYFTYSNHVVLRDPEDGLYKCWYEDLMLLPKAQRPHRVHHRARQLYAESKDGVHWHKPQLDFVVEDGHRTNIVLGSGAGGADDVHSMGVVIDPHPAHPQARFRAIFSHCHWQGNKRVSERIACAHSPDGIHWQLYDEPPRIGISGAKLDDVSVPFYDEDSRQFVQNTRHFLKGQGGYGAPWGGRHYYASDTRRRVWQSRSHDFIHWSEPILVAAVDEDDGFDEQFYGMAQSRMGMVHLATLGVLRWVDNEMDVQLLMSRDGLRWQQTNKRQPFLDPRGEGHHDAHMVSITSPPIVVDDQIRFYHGAAACHHDWWLWGPDKNLDHPEARDPENLARYSLGLGTLRKEGYCSLYANPHREGRIQTQAMISDGTQLRINGRCGASGTIRVEIRDAEGVILEPCSKTNCDPFTGNSVGHTVTWNGNPDIPEKTWRKITFFLQEAEIFSFQFTASKSQGTWANVIHALGAPDASSQSRTDLA